MKTIFYASPTRKEYFSPECDILDLKPEGIICTSAPGDTEPGDIVDDSFGEFFFKFF